MYITTGYFEITFENTFLELFSYMEISFLVIFLHIKNNFLIFAENLRYMNKIKDYPVVDKYPYSDDLCRDIDENLLTYPNVPGRVVSMDRDGNGFVGTVSHVIKDRKEFVKLYRDGIRIMLGLSYTAQRVLAYIMDVMKPNSQYVEIITGTCMSVCGFKTPKSVRDGILELLGKNVIARNPYNMRYWVNPMLLFNGDRVKFIKEYIFKEEN